MSFTLAELVAEGGEFIVRDISGGATARYARFYFSSFYRFEDVTELVMATLALPLVRANGMHTGAIWGTDEAIVARICAAAQPASMVAATPCGPTPPSPPPPPAGGKRVRIKAPAPPRPPRGGTAVR